MAIIATRINNSGTYLVNGSFDEVTTSTIRVTTDTVYASLIDEVTYNLTAPIIKNLLTYSEQYINWGVSISTVTSDQVVAPNRTLTADQIVANLTGYVYQSIATTPVVAYTFSFWVKSVSGATGTWGINWYSGTSGHHRQTVPITGIWNRVFITFTTDDVSTNIYVSDNRSGLATITDGYVWGAQFERSSAATIYQGISSSNTLINPNFAKREDSDGIVYVTDQFDEFTGAPIVDSSLKLWLDAGQSSSYSGSGSTWTSLVSIVSTTTLTTTTYTSSIGGSIHFDGTNGYASLQVPSLNTTYCTVEMLCRFNALGARMPFGWTVYDVYTASNNIGYNTGASDLYGIPAATVSSLGILGNWKHFCFVMQNNIIYPAVPYTNNKIYVNGTNQTLVQILSTQSGTTRSFSNGIGKISGWATDFNYKAMMDLAVFNVYNRELTADEITQNFNALRRRYGI